MFKAPEDTIAALGLLGILVSGQTLQYFLIVTLLSRAKLLEDMKCIMSPKLF